MAIEVLETMADECVVAGKSAKLLQKATEKAMAARHQRNSERIAGTLMSMTVATRHQPHHLHQQQQQQHVGTSGSGMAGGSSGGGGGGGGPMGVGPAMTPTDSDHGGGGGGVGGGHTGGGGGSAAHHHQHHGQHPSGQGQGTPGGWPDPTLGINWMHAWAPVNLLDSDMIDFELGMPFMGFDTADVPRPG